MASPEVAVGVVAEAGTAETDEKMALEVGLAMLAVVLAMEAAMEALMGMVSSTAESTTPRPIH